jgi:hypothetical protein
MTAMNEVLEEKLQNAAKVLGQVAESAAEKASDLVEDGALDLSSVARGATKRARRGGKDAAAGAKSQLRSGVRGARSGLQELIDQKDSLADLGPSADDIRQVKKSIRRFEKSAKRQGRDLAHTLDKKTGRRRQKAKAKKTGGRAAIVVVAAMGIGFVVALVVRKEGSGGSQTAYSPPSDAGRAPSTPARTPGPTEVPEPNDSEAGVRSGSRANGS